MSDRQLPGRNGLRVLVADDDPIQRNLIAARLVSMNGEAIEAEDGLAAWSLLLSQTFDLAIVDLGMPDLDGFGLIQCMRGHPRTRHLPIVVVTSRGDRASMDAALHAGASSFLVKPIAWGTFEHHLGFLMRLVQSADEARDAEEAAMSAFEDLSRISTNLSRHVDSGAAVLSRELMALKCSLAGTNATPKALAQIEKMADVCGGLKQQIELAISRAPAAPDRKAPGRRQEDLSSILEEVRGIVEPVADSAGVGLNTTFPAQSVAVAADRKALVMALRYLLLDAIMHVGRGVDLHLSAMLESDGALAIDIGGTSGGWPVDIVPPSSPLQEAAFESLGRSSGPSIGLLLARTIFEGFKGKLQLITGTEGELHARLVLPSGNVTALHEAA